MDNIKQVIFSVYQKETSRFLIFIFMWILNMHKPTSLVQYKFMQNIIWNPQKQRPQTSRTFYKMLHVCIHSHQ